MLPFDFSTLYTKTLLGKILHSLNEITDFFKGGALFKYP